MSKHQQLIVKKNAPGWPAMVEVCKTNKINSEISGIKNAASSIWLETYYKQKSNSQKDSSFQDQVKTLNSNKNTGVFASKSRLVRQCMECQVLYTNFHKCVDT
jgi:hypothetical protein